MQRYRAAAPHLAAASSVYTFHAAPASPSPSASHPAPSSPPPSFSSPLQLRANEKALDYRCNEIQDLYALIDSYNIPVPPIDRAAFGTLDSSYTSLKTVMEEVESNKEENISKYSINLESGGCDRAATAIPMSTEWYQVVPEMYQNALHHGMGFSSVTRRVGG